MLTDLKSRRQWVVSKIVRRDDKNTKPPFQINGQRASVTDPSTWCTYEEAKASGWPFIGYVLTEEDPYTFIDLDPPKTDEQALRHKAIIKAFDTYTETSQSGKGYHLIMKGKVPRGARRDRVEVYSSERFMITTENPINDRPIEDRQELLTTLYDEISRHGVVKELIDGLEVATDGELLEIANRAENGAKFSRLWEGNQEGYPSQSEADYALLSMLCFYSRNTGQVMRMFRASALGQRKKAQRDNYLLSAIQKIRSNEPPMVDISNLSTPATVQDKPKEIARKCTFPPGLIGELALYIYQSAVRPVPEVGLAGALALMGGVCGRAYNISNTGLNQYVILLARTGAGKDGALSGIERIIAQTRKKIPSIDTRLGPAGFASGQALLKALDRQQCFVSVLGEFGLTLQKICDPKASSSDIMLRKVLLDLYSRSGQGSYLRPHCYAEEAKNTSTIESPAVTILGEGTPETFFEGITPDHIAEGLIPRFTVIEYFGQRPPTNRNKFYKPDSALLTRFVDMATHAMELDSRSQVRHVGASLGALEILDRFDEYADDQINREGAADTVAQLWNRAHLKALKLSALVAVGCNHKDPEVTEEIAQWSVAFVKDEIACFLFRFTEEKIETLSTKRDREVVAAMRKYYTTSDRAKESYRVPRGLMPHPEMVPYVFLLRKLRTKKLFTTDSTDPAQLLDGCLRRLLLAEEVLEYSTHQTSSFGTKQRVFSLK